MKTPRALIWDSRLDVSDKEHIDSLNASLSRLSGLRAIQINVAGPFAKSKIAWKLACHQHALLHRLIELYDGAAVAWNNDSILTSMLAARAFMETFALMADYRQAVQRHTQNEDLPALDALAQNGMFATRDAELLKSIPDAKATNAVTYIDKFDKRLVGFQEHYDVLSERCHPNSQGHNFMFATLDRTNGTVDYATDKEARRNGHHILTALSTLPLVETYMADLDRTIEDIAELHHRVAPVGGL